MTFDRIREARENYFKKKPFDPHKNILPSHDENGIPVGFLSLPDMDEMQVVAMKYGYELLATCKDDDDIDAWLANLIKTAQSADLMGIMVVHAIRGVIPIVANLIDTQDGMRTLMQSISANGWEKDFDEPEETDE